MANVNSLSSNSYSSTSSIYGSRNVLTGLASGMDTETMIENSVTGYQTKISQLQQSQTKLEWKQDAYRELIDQMYSITNKYTSYTSKTNLSSNSFFTNNMVTTANGANAAAISATGTANSDVRIDAVTKLASAARYAVDASALGVKATGDAKGGAINWGEQLKVGKLSGTMTLKVGNNSLDIKFTEEDQYDDLDALVSGINKKLGELSATSKKDGSVKGSDLVEAQLDGNTVKLVYKGPDGDSAYINSVSGNLAKMLGASNPTSTKIEDKIKNTSFTVPEGTALVEEPNMAQYLSGKTVDITLDGVTKQIKIGDLASKTITLAGGGESAQLSELDASTLNENKDALNQLLASDLQASIDKQFGANKVTVSVADGGLAFDVSKGSGSTLKVSSGVSEALLGTKAGVSNYFNTSQRLGDLLATDTQTGEEWLNANARVAAAEGGIRTEGSGDDAKYYDSEGNQVKLDESDGKYYRVKDDEWMYSLEINGARVGEFTKDTALESVLSSINSSSSAGVKVTYSNLTSQFVFTANETGEGGSISFDDALANRLFGYADGNAPASKTIGELLGDAVEWDENGQATLKLSSPIANPSLGVFSRDDSVEKLQQALGSVSNGAFANLLHYDAASGAYSMRNDEGEEMPSGIYGNFSIFAENQSGSGASFDRLLENANARRGFTAGTDAEVRATVNGKELTLKRSTNVINMDGLSVTLKDTFNVDENGKAVKGEAVTFTTNSNADTIVDAVKSFVDDVNKLMNSVHDAYATQPLKKTSSGSSSSSYEPLTENDKKDMSESAISAYEEKAKKGLLFGDSDLRTLYDKLLTGIQSYGSDRVDMESIGLTTTYSGGVTTISLDENKLRAALDSNPDKVRTVFTKTTGSGSSTNGLMASLKSTLNAYGSTSLGSPGILVSKAGTKLSAVSLLNNNLQKQISNLESQIESWQSKLSDKIDYYTKQFTQLEKLMSTMNNQSSMLSDLMGY